MSERAHLIKREWLRSRLLRTPLNATERMEACFTKPSQLLAQFNDDCVSTKTFSNALLLNKTIKIFIYGVLGLAQSKSRLVIGTVRAQTMVELPRQFLDTCVFVPVFPLFHSRA